MPLPEGNLSTAGMGGGYRTPYGGLYAAERASEAGFPGKYHYYPGRSTMGVFLAAFFTIVLIVATVFFLSMIMSGKPESR
jgi:hypothetical protein